MNEGTDVETENVSADAEKDAVSETSQNQEETENKSAEEVKSEEDLENATNLEKSAETKDEIDEDIGGPPTVENSEGGREDQWCDNYQFVEDEKLPINYDGDDPQKQILLAAQNNELDVLRKLLEKDPNLVNARDNDLYTPLHRASYSNNVEVIRILLSYDADVRAKTIDGWEPLHCACKWDSVEAVSLLIQNGADVNAQTKGHITPLHLAASNVYGRRTLELLLWHPYVDPNVKNDGGDTAYDIACRSGPLGALFEILEESVNVY